MITRGSRLAGRTTWLAAVAFALVALVHLGSQLGSADDLGRVTQAALMPLLALTLALATGARGTLVRLTLLALGFSWLGDTVPAFLDGDAAFLSLVGCFLLAQLVYVVAFWPYRDRSVLTRPMLLIPYATVFVALVAACAAQAGPMLAAIVVYGMCIVTMAVLATGLNRVAAVGATLFLASDSMIALGEFTTWYHPPVAGFWVMSTYIAAQALIVAGVAHKSRPVVLPG